MEQNNQHGTRVLGFLTQVTDTRRQDVFQSVTDISTPQASFYSMVVISGIIAAYGLLANSTAVVIGAMLVAPLMGPIFGIALSLIAGDRTLLGRASVAEILGIILAVLVGITIGLVPLRPDFGTEILGRTQPTIYDIIIAVASALAGTYAIIDPRISPALPGVAMATALVPP